MKEHRVVVTGLGAVTPVGIGWTEFWDGLKAGKNGVSRVTHFDPSDFPSRMAAEVKNFRPEDWMDLKSAARMDRFAQFSLAASVMGMEDAGLTLHPFDPKRAGVIIGSGIGGSETIEKGYTQLQAKGPRSLNPFFVSKILINMAACLVSIRFGLKGPLFPVCGLFDGRQRRRGCLPDSAAGKRRHHAGRGLRSVPYAAGLRRLLRHPVHVAPERLPGEGQPPF